MNVGFCHLVMPRASFPVSVFLILIGRSKGIMKGFVALESYSNGNVTLHLKGLPIQELPLDTEMRHKCSSFPAMSIFIGGEFHLRAPVCS